jgi:hypothetical protein
MLKKAGMVVLGATAGMLSLAPLASAGEAHSHGGDHGHGQHESHAGDCGASAVSGGQGNSGSQLIGANNVNVQAPINQLGVLADQDGDCGGGGHDGHRHGGRHGGHDRDGDHGRDGGGATAISRGQGNSGNQLIGLNNVNAQVPINQLGILAQQRNG